MTKIFDNVVFATHADDILNLLEKPTKIEKKIFSSYHYEKNKVFVHQDESLMPSNKKVWSAWNVILNKKNTRFNDHICVTYWINKLQNFKSLKPVFVTLNPPKEFNINRKVTYWGTWIQYAGCPSI